MPILISLIVSAAVIYGFWRREKRTADRRTLEATKYRAQLDMDASDAYHEMRAPGYADTLMRIYPWRTAEQHERLMARAHPNRKATP